MAKRRKVQITMRELNKRVREVLGEGCWAIELHSPLGVAVGSEAGTTPSMTTRTGDRDSSRRLAMAWLAAMEYEASGETR